METTLGSKLKSLRLIKRLSLRNVESLTKISNAYLSQLENDKIKKPSPHFLHKLAQIYGVEYEVLMEQAGYLVSGKVMLRPKATWIASVLENSEMTADEQSQLLEYLQFLRRKR